MEQIKEAAALLREGLLTAAEFEVVKRQAIAAAAGTTPVKLEPVAPPAPVAADVVADAGRADHGASNGGGQREAARAGPEPTCVRSAKRRAVGVAGVAGASLHRSTRGCPTELLDQPALKVRGGSLSVLTSNLDAHAGW